MANLPGVKEYTIQWYITRFSDARDRAISFCQPISEPLFIQRPAEDRWSIAECYSHLNEFGEIYLENIRDGLATAPTSSAENEERPFPPRLLWKGVIKLFAPPYRLKMKTVKPFSPASKARLKKQPVLDRFVHLQDAFIDELTTAWVNSVDLNKIKVSNPLLKFVRMTLSESFAVAEVHQRRHIWQAQQVWKQLT
ncbi:DinB family protein [Halalkalibaculum sp. DA3122]|uniref:DinB family protein n=1 Tax=Halalkalibaculum sp. DA3122 TaxID=3373607 RepID=UPI0037548E39